MSIDPRLLERRQSVAEENAHRSLGRLLRFLAVIVVLAGLAWLALSPWLSVSRVHTVGVVSSNTHSFLTQHGIVVGAPMIFLPIGDVESSLEADPWVVEARVERDWPDEVVVRVIERIPVVWVQSAEGWSWRAIDGVAVPGPGGPTEASPRLIATGLLESELDGSLLVEGVAEFVVSLPEGLRQGLTLDHSSGELWAKIEGFDVRLGRPVDMEAKARSLTALLGEDLPPGATLILVAPTHPAVEMPGENEEAVDADSDASSADGGGEGSSDG